MKLLHEAHARMRTWVRGETGQTLAEYGLIVVLASIVIVVPLATGLSGVIPTLISPITVAFGS